MSKDKDGNRYRGNDTDRLPGQADFALLWCIACKGFTGHIRNGWALKRELYYRYIGDTHPTTLKTKRKVMMYKCDSCEAERGWGTIK